MQKLDSKKIENALRQLENAAKFAVRTLNEMTDNSYKDSVYEKESLKNIGVIGLTLQMAQEQAKSQVKYEGMDAEQVAELQAAERVSEREALQQAIQEKLAGRKPVEPEPTEETQSTEGSEDDPDPNNEKRPDPVIQ